MKNAIKTIATLMMLVTINMVSAQSFTNQALIVSSNNDAVNTADQLFDVNVQNTDGIMNIIWNLPIANMEGYYITERSDDGVNYKPIALKHFNNVPANNQQILAMQYTVVDKNPTVGTVYYRFSKSTLQGDVLQASVIPYVTPAVDFSTAVTAKTPQP
jgi:hypothetical protein